MTSNDLIKPNKNAEATVKPTSNRRNKSILKTGSLHEIIETNDIYLDQILDNKKI